MESPKWEAYTDRNEIAQKLTTYRDNMSTSLVAKLRRPVAPHPSTVGMSCLHCRHDEMSRTPVGTVYCASCNENCLSLEDPSPLSPKSVSGKNPTAWGLGDTEGATDCDAIQNVQSVPQ